MERGIRVAPKLKKNNNNKLIKSKAGNQCGSAAKIPSLITWVQSPEPTNWKEGKAPPNCP